MDATMSCIDAVQYEVRYKKSLNLRYARLQVILIYNVSMDTV